MEFRRGVVQVRRNCEPNVGLEKIADDFGIHPITLSTRLKTADTENGVKSAMRPAESVELYEADMRIRLFEQEAEVLKPALAYMLQGSLPGNGYTGS